MFLYLPHRAAQNILAAAAAAPAAAAGGKREHDEVSEGSRLFAWFSNDDTDVELAEVLKEDIWQDPLKYFTDEGDEEGEGR